MARSSEKLLKVKSPTEVVSPIYCTISLPVDWVFDVVFSECKWKATTTCQQAPLQQNIKPSHIYIEQIGKGFSPTYQRNF